jgi:SLBB domain
LKFRYLYILFIGLMFSSNIIAQITDEELGKTLNNSYRTGLYDFSDPGAVNIKVSVWGYVSRPGKYIVPDYTTVSDLLSFAGGPNQSAETDDLRIYRVLDNGKEDLIKFSYNDIIWDDGLEVRNRVIPKLIASDILIVPGSPRLFFTDWFRIGLQVFSAVLSIASFILLLNRYK